MKTTALVLLAVALCTPLLAQVPAFAYSEQPDTAFCIREDGTVFSVALAWKSTADGRSQYYILFSDSTLAAFRVAADDAMVKRRAAQGGVVGKFDPSSISQDDQEALRIIKEQVKAGK
jgi:hypothetical protein